MPRSPIRLAVVAALIVSFGALALVAYGRETSAAQPLHGIALAKGCASPIVIGQLYTCDVLTINNVDTAGDTLTITSIIDVVHAGAGDQTSANLLPGLSLTLSGGATCSVGQTMCTLPAGASITTASPYGFYIAQAGDPNPLPDTVHLVWQDLCTSLALNCPLSDQTATAGSSAILQSPTPTPTPPPPDQQKSCDPAEAATNTGPGPSCNLFVCVPNGPVPYQNIATCAGPGEGDLVILERVLNVQTAAGIVDAGTPTPTAGVGLGAYEFNVEFDNLVIRSVNPADIVFSAGGAGAARGPANCTPTIPSENSIRFGCVTTSDTPNGPVGGFDLARLDLIPAADIVGALSPGNDNGIPTLIKDNQCELADTLGHPVLKTGPGLLSTCGDALVTVRVLEGDVNLDCVVDVADEALISLHYGAVFGSALYDRWFDLEPRFHDLDIDIKDLEKVYSRDGSTCQRPIPAQPPVPPLFGLGG
jgi:hypothetical protein